MAYIVALLLLVESILGIVFFAGALVGIHDYLLLCPSGSTGLMASIQWWQPLAFFGVLLLCWILAGRTSSMYTINGSGTKLLGNTPFPNGHISTKWISILFFPVLPVDSYEVGAEQQVGMGAQYLMNRLDDFYWPQVVSTAAKGLLIFMAILISLAVLFSFIPCAHPH